ncbi:MAG TPA: 2-C-methyl-D-erythritol 4-phosphate cytidylyltransferase, partial [Symbiobacteriaceae bacterium]|nr:2-C-methyl-D-erythritol 4-phosphate cytidylyltransferase [Symbiobacteriaceae bacterium]
MSIQIGGLQVAVSAIIPAAGSGKRMGGGTAKQFLPLRGEPVLVR